GPKGQIGNYRFYPAVMRSRARLTYTVVAAALANPQGEAARGLKGLLPRLQLLEQLFKALLRAREERGAIDFETIEPQFVFDEQNRLLRIDRVERNDAHRIIEECMLAANVCSSDFLSARKHPTLYRVHEGPTPEKLKALREFLKGFGLQLAGGDKPAARHYAKLLESVRKRPDVQLLQTVLLRSLQQAQYSPENVGHFGLAYEHYTHFTSPIRRYPDLLIHRAIKAVLGSGRYRPGDWAQLGAHCSQTERRGDARGRRLAQVLLHARPRRRGVRGLGVGRHRVRHLRRARRFLRRGAGAHLRAGTGLLPVRRRAAPARRRPHSQDVPSRRPR